jgi:hypothetical protein
MQADCKSVSHGRAKQHMTVVSQYGALSSDPIASGGVSVIERAMAQTKTSRMSGRWSSGCVKRALISREVPLG